MLTYYVKKIWSLNPTKYKFISYQKAQNLYFEWVTNILKQATDKKYYSSGTHIKTFEEWLKTEI